MQIKTNNTEIYKQLKDLPSNYIITNMPQFEDIDIRFYTDYHAYYWIGEDDYLTLRARGYRFAAFERFAGQAAPAYILQDSTTLIIDKQLMK